ncbi:MAG: MlaD family protein, partial [Verrucomicrobiota bacterium]
MSADPQAGRKTDHGQIVSTHNRTIAWFWLFPLIAALATGWLFYSQWASKGPSIEITFEEAPGIEPGKTRLFYRGVNSGTVESVRVLEDLKSVTVKVRLEGFAAGLATEQTVFWIDRPVVSLTELTGLESIISGNSIQAGTPGGIPKFTFQGHPKPPILQPDANTFTAWIDGQSIPFLNRGTPVYYRGVRVGAVCQKTLTPEGLATIQLSIEPAYRATVRTSSRFWAVPWTSISLGPGGLTIQAPGADALLQGGLAYDDFGNAGEPAESNARFPFHDTETAARASAPPLVVNFKDSRGLRAGHTPVCYLGYPVGLVEKVDADPANQTIRATIRLQPEFQNLATSTASFTLVRPRFSLEGVSNLDTMLLGAYLALEPGTGGEPATAFSGTTLGDDEWLALQTAHDGLKIRLVADSLPNIEKGAPVLHRGIAVGTVLEKTLDEKNQPALEIAIRPEFKNSLSSNSRFWRVPATSIKAGPGVLQVDIEGIESLLRGGVTFETFGASGKPVLSGESFRLF